MKTKYFSNQKFQHMKNFKFYFVLTFLFMTTGVLMAQESEEPRYLIGNKDGEVNVSGFGSYFIGFSSLYGDVAVYNGGGGAVLLNQSVYFGGYGLGLSTRHGVESITLEDYDGHYETYDDLNTKFGHGGFWIGYLHKSYKPVHFGASTKIGWGSIALENDYVDPNFNEYSYYQIVTDNVFVINPQVEVELNLLRWFKINASAGWQFVTGVDKTYTNEAGESVQFFKASDFNKPMFNLAFMFGGFGGKR